MAATKLYERRSEREFYDGLPYGGPEWDFGGWWSAPGDEGQPWHERGQWRVSWMPLSGDWYATNGREYVWLGRSTPRDSALAERIAHDYGEQCERRASFVVIARRLAPYVYGDQEKAARAYGKRVGIEGNGGGWLYFKNHQRPIGQGWWRFSKSLLASGKIERRWGGWAVTTTANTSCVAA